MHSEQTLEEALEISQAKEFVDSKPGKLEFMIEQNGRNLSGGQRQRMTIAKSACKKTRYSYIGRQCVGA